MYYTVDCNLDSIPHNACYTVYWSFEKNQTSCATPEGVKCTTVFFFKKKERVHIILYDILQSILYIAQYTT